MGNFDYKKWVTENKYGKLNEVEDLELKSLAKKFIPIIKKYKMGVEYETDTTEFETKPDDVKQTPPAKLITKEGTLTVGVYFLSLARAGGKQDAGDTPETRKIAQYLKTKSIHSIPDSPIVLWALIYSFINQTPKIIIMRF